jgi:hypothetical protein
MQYLHEKRSGLPTLYYSSDSGVGRALAALEGANRHIGVVGLGAGTLAAYGRPGDRIRFYEINPDVEKAARQYFTYLRNSSANVIVVVGDGRLSLEREPSQAFDLLVLDAFSGDAIPTHLLTREAFEIYRRHLKPGGMIATHVSNMSLDLRPPVLRLAREGGWTAVVLEQPRADYEEGVLPSIWILQSLSPGFSDSPPIRGARRADAQVAAGAPLWTDDFSALFPLLRRAGDSIPAAKSGVLHAQSVANLARGSNVVATLARFRQELSRNPESALAMNNLAVLLATAPDASLRNGAEAVRLAEQASALTKHEHPVMLTTLAAAYAETGRFADAIRTAEQAIQLARQAGADALVNRNLQLLEYYRQGEAYHQQDKAPPRAESP